MKHQPLADRADADYPHPNRVTQRPQSRQQVRHTVRLSITNTRAKADATCREIGCRRQALPGDGREGGLDLGSALGWAGVNPRRDQRGSHQLARPQPLGKLLSRQDVDGVLGASRAIFEAHQNGPADAAMFTPQLAQSLEVIGRHACGPFTSIATRRSSTMKSTSMPLAKRQ